MIRLVSPSEAATEAIAAQLAAQLEPRGVVLLHGDLGAGKTAFVRGLAIGLGIDAGEVSSPTFTLAHEYRGGRVPLHHVDLYRLAGTDAETLGLEELAASDGIVAIEWAARLPRPLHGAIAVTAWHAGGDLRVFDVTSPPEQTLRLDVLPEVWLRGPLSGVAAPLQPVVHALLQVREDAARALAGQPTAVVWARPAGAASLGFHARHLVGSLDRLLTYAHGSALTGQQLSFLQTEAEAGTPPATAGLLLDALSAAIDAAIADVAATPPDSLYDRRTVGRAALPTTVIGLLVHLAEHSARHAGQMLTTSRVVAPPTPPRPAPAHSR